MRRGEPGWGELEAPRPGHVRRLSRDELEGQGAAFADRQKVTRTAFLTGRTSRMPIEVKRMKDEKLAELYIQVVEEMRDRATTQAKDPFAVIGGHEAAKRAIVVAAAGKHSILFVGPTGCGKTMLGAAAARVGVVSWGLRPCPCGFFTHPSIRCRCARSQINLWWLARKHSEASIGMDMLVDVPPVPQAVIDAKQSGADLASVQHQLSGVGPKPTWDDAADETARALIEQAIRERGLPPGVVSTTKRIAETIAALARESSILALHAIEALAYRPSLDRILRG